MHLLYLDDAGSASTASEQYLVLGGVSVFEAQAHWITQQLDTLAENLNPEDPHGVEFHASETFSRRSQPWKRMTKDAARGAIKSVLNVLAEAYESARAFACVVHKDSFPNRDPMEVAFEDLCSRFDLYLKRLRAEGDTQRGLVILDKSSHETTLQQMAVDFRTLVTSWGVIKNLEDTPLFVDPRASGCIRLAERVAYADSSGDDQRADAQSLSSLSSSTSSMLSPGSFTGWFTRNSATQTACVSPDYSRHSGAV